VSAVTPAVICNGKKSLIVKQKTKNKKQTKTNKNKQANKRKLPTGSASLILFRFLGRGRRGVLPINDVLLGLGPPRVSQQRGLGGLQEVLDGRLFPSVRPRHGIHTVRARLILLVQLDRHFGTITVQVIGGRLFSPHLDRRDGAFEIRRDDQASLAGLFDNDGQLVVE